MSELLRVGIAPGVDPELVAGTLWALGASAIEERDEGGGIVLVAGFPTSDAAHDVATSLTDDMGVGAVELVTIEDAEWQDAWKPFAEPVDVGAGLRVVPAWKPTTPDG